MTPEEIKALQDKVAELELQIETLTADVESANKKNSDLDELVDELEGKLSKTLAAGSSSLPEVEVDGKKYQIMYPKIQHENHTYTVEDLISNTQVCKELVEMGSGMLTEIA